jgi:hypothetical protein
MSQSEKAQQGKGDIFKMFATDKAKELEGVEIAFGDGVYIRVARDNNPLFKKVFRRLTKPYERQISDGRMDEEVATELLCDALAEAVFIGMRGVKIGDEPLEDTVANRKRLLMELPDFRRAIETEASNAERFRAAAVDEEGKG